MSRNASSNSVVGRKKANKISWFQQNQETAVDSLSRLMVEPGSSFLTWSVIGIALALPVCLLLFLQNLQQLNRSLDQAGNISLFMDIAISEAALENNRREIEAMEEVLTVTAISAETALVEFQATSGLGNVLENLDENPLPPVLVVTPAETALGSLPVLAGELDARPDVEYVQVDLEWVQRLFAIIGFAERLAAGLALLLGLGVILAVGNTVRLAIENRRDEILVMKLVGGTDAYVARPFLYTGIWYGIGGGLISIFLVLIVFLFLSGPLSQLLTLYGSDYSLAGISVSNALLLLVTAGGLGFIGACVTVIRQLKNIEPA